MYKLGEKSLLVVGAESTGCERVYRLGEKSLQVRRGESIGCGSRVYWL